MPIKPSPAKPLKSNKVPKLLVFITLVVIILLGYKVANAKKETLSSKKIQSEIQNLSILYRSVENIIEVKPTDRKIQNTKILLAHLRNTLNEIKIKTKNNKNPEINEKIVKIANALDLLKVELILLEENQANQQKIQKDLINSHIEIMKNPELDENTKISLFKKLLTQPQKLKNENKNPITNAQSATLPIDNNTNKAIDNNSTINNQPLSKETQFLLFKNNDIEAKLELQKKLEEKIKTKISSLNIKYKINSLHFEYEELTEEIIQESYLIIISLFFFLFLMTLVITYLLGDTQTKNRDLEAEVKERTKELEEKILIEKAKLNKDLLTNTFNKRYFFDEGAKQYQNAIANKKQVSIALLDIDFFKNINDTYDYEVGDALIKSIPLVIFSIINKENCILARFKKDEFALIDFHSSSQKFQDNLEKIRIKIHANPIAYKNIKIEFSVSIGCTTDKHKNIDNAIRTADDALYQSKEAGRNKITHCNNY